MLFVRGAKKQYRRPFCAGGELSTMLLQTGLRAVVEFQKKSAYQPEPVLRPKRLFFFFDPETGDLSLPKSDYPILRITNIDTTWRRTSLRARLMEMVLRK